MSSKVIDLKPLTGVLDVRSMPDSVSWGGFRDRLNLATSEEGRLCRREGWVKFLDDTLYENEVYNNQDLHDQMLPMASGTQTEEPITFLMDVESTTGQRRLLAGTQRRLYGVNYQLGTWQMLANGYGGAFTNLANQRRWRAAQVLDTIVFTNNYDPPLAWTFGSSPTATQTQAVSVIEDLAEKINLTRAGMVCAFRNVMFLGDVVLDGARNESTVVWSDYKRPLSFDPGVTGTKASQETLAFGERILAGMPLGDYLLIYTTKGIWQITVVGGDEIFNFRQIYNGGHNGEACLAYPNTLVNLGDAHMFMGRDGIYLFNLNLSKPERLEWLHKASGILYDTIRSDCVQLHNAWYWADTKEVWFSASIGTSVLPNMTLAANMRYHTADRVDQGFSAMCSCLPLRQMTLRDFFREYCICTEAELDSNTEKKSVYWDAKLGMPTYAAAQDACTPPTSIFTTTQRTLSNGLVVEDYLRDTADVNSLCSRMAAAGITRVEDLCQDNPVTPVFVLASATDWCLKQYGGAYSREVLTDGDETGTVLTGDGNNLGYQSVTATYTTSGYWSRLLTSPLDFKQPELLKLFQRLEVELAPQQTSVTPPELRLRVGAAAQAVDPLTAAGYCVIKWQQQDGNRFYVECQSEATLTEHDAANTRPSKTVAWPLYWRGNYLYWELAVVDRENRSVNLDAPSGVAPVNGGACFSRVSVTVNQ